MPTGWCTEAERRTRPTGMRTASHRWPTSSRATTYPSRRNGHGSSPRLRSGRMIAHSPRRRADGMPPPVGHRLPEDRPPCDPRSRTGPRMSGRYAAMPVSRHGRMRRVAAPECLLVHAEPGQQDQAHGRRICRCGPWSVCLAGVVTRATGRQVDTKNGRDTPGHATG